MQRFVLILALLTGVVSDASSDSYAPVRLDSLLKYSDFVGLIEITYGEFRPRIGTVYKATVIEQLKGNYPDSTIYFGLFSRYEIGGKYLATLSLSDSLAITPRDNRLVSRIPSADSLTSFFNIMFLGFGMMPIEYVYLEPDPPKSSTWGRNDDAVKVSTSHVMLPIELKSFPVGCPEQEFSADNMWKNRWVRSKTMLLFLRQLSERIR